MNSLRPAAYSEAMQLRVFVSAAIAALAAIGAPAEAKPRPNLLLITLDTCRADRLGCYGYPLARTPAIDALARSGIMCTNAVTTAPITMPAHASIMTGLLPPAHGVRDNGAYALAEAYETLAETLSRAGYDTAAFVSAVVLSRRYGLAQGFDHYDDDLWAEDEPALFMIRDRPAPRTAARAVAWLDQWKSTSENPFFVWAHFFDPHQPYESRYRHRHLVPTPYDAEIAQADEGVAAIVNWLDTARALDNTLVVVTADHGESLGEHGEKTHAIFVYDATVRIPLVFRWPRFPAGARYDGPVRCTDIMPTVLAAAGIPLQEPVQGVNLMDALRGDAPPPEPPQYSESLVSELGFGMAPLYAVRTNGKKWIRAPKPELYELLADPGERNNLYRGSTAESQQLEQRLQALIDDSTRYAKGTAAVAVDAEMQEALRALGYVALPRDNTATSGIDPKDGLALYTKLEEARHAAQRNDLASAEKLLREIVAEAPRHVTARNVLGFVLMRAGRFPEAEAELEQSLAIEPAQARARHLVGVAAWRQNKIEKAQHACEKALELSPNLVESMVILGFIAVQQKKTDDAERWYRRAIEADPSFPRAHLAYADLYFLRGEHVQALQHYRNVVQSLPNHFVAHLQAGLCAVQLNDFGLARHFFAKAADLRPDSWMPPYNLACVAALRGEPEDAMAQLRRAAELAASPAEVARHARGDPDFARLRENSAFTALLDAWDAQSR